MNPQITLVSCTRKLRKLLLYTIEATVRFRDSYFNNIVILGTLHTTSLLKILKLAEDKRLM